MELIARVNAGVSVSNSQTYFNLPPISPFQFQNPAIPKLAGFETGAREYRPLLGLCDHSILSLSPMTHHRLPRSGRSGYFLDFSSLID